MRHRVRQWPRLARQDLLVTAIPRRCRRTILDETSGTLASAFRNPLSLLPRMQVTTLDPTAADTDDTFNLREDEVEELERGDETEVDDDPARERAVRVVGRTPEEHHELSDKAWARRSWEVVLYAPPQHETLVHRRPSSSFAFIRFFRAVFLH